MRKQTLQTWLFFKLCQPRRSCQGENWRRKKQKNNNKTRTKHTRNIASHFCTMPTRLWPRSKFRLDSFWCVTPVTLAAMFISLSRMKPQFRQTWDDVYEKGNSVSLGSFGSHLRKIEHANKSVTGTEMATAMWEVSRFVHCVIAAGSPWAEHAGVKLPEKRRVPR